ncbi:MAG TPA: NAD(P)H-dependent oxidoreductase [Methanomassiliicoccales archaeon]|nr:NAD(P)H-dependent oxidoreductase [Methanomassiliicoccales archaeon]
MRALILDGTVGEGSFDRSVGMLAAELLKGAGWEVDHLLLSEMSIAPCTGCFNCWIRTPGECSQQDEAEKVVRAMAKASLWVYVTPVIFGGFSYQLKKGLDRLIPILLPEFKVFANETHHPLRYHEGFDVLGIGINEAEDAEWNATFKTLVKRNALNAHSKHNGAIVVERGRSFEEVRSSLSACLKEAGLS